MIIDVRTPMEYANGHLDGAVNMDAYDPTLPIKLGNLDMNGTYRVYCQSGNRSGQIATYMKQAGFSNVADLGGIFMAAASTGIPVVR